jgi:hypothetical protein
VHPRGGPTHGILKVEFTQVPGIPAVLVRAVA